MRCFRILSLLLACLLTLTACGEQTAPVQDADPDALTLFDCGGLEAALPGRYLDLLYIERNAGTVDGETPLLSVYEKASYDYAQSEYGEAGGFLFGLVALDQAAFEQLIGADGSGIDVFAADGQRYYAYTYPTDVQFFRPEGEPDSESEDWKTWEELNEIGPSVREDFLTRNQLQTFSIQDLASQPFALDETHVCLRYYPYFLQDGDTRVYYDLLLSQPARQGEGGIWAVERWMNQFGIQALYFPDSGRPAAEYYADLQTESEDHPELLTPAGAAAVFVSDYFGHETAEGSFERVSELDQAYMEQNRRLQETVLDLMAGRNVEPLALLDCTGGTTADNWGVLGRSLYGSDWFQPLIQAVASAAVGGEQARRDRNMMSFYLAVLDAETDFRTPLQSILSRQNEADPDAFLTALADFPVEESAVLEAAVGDIGNRPAASLNR